MRANGVKKEERAAFTGGTEENRLRNEWPSAPMISDVDIHRVANLLIERHGADALLEAARLIDLMLDRGDEEGRRVWLRIKRAIVTLQAPRVDSPTNSTGWPHHSSFGGMSMSVPSKFTGSMLMRTLNPSPLPKGQAAPTVTKMSRSLSSLRPVLARTV
jgi:hypothetical protein